MKWSIALLGTVACATPAPVAPSNHCPGHDDLASLLAQPVDLDLRVHDDFGWDPSCKSPPEHVVRVTIDNAPWCEVRIPCTTTIQAPAPTFPCTGKPLKAGARHIGVELDARPATEMLRTMSLPAFDYTRDGSVFVGAHVSVWVDDKTILIDPPTASEQLMM
jgi:hypothetical protein